MTHKFEPLPTESQIPVYLEALSQTFLATSIFVRGAPVLIISIPHQSAVSFLDGRAFIRTGDQTVEANPDKICCDDQAICAFKLTLRTKKMRCEQGVLAVRSEPNDLGPVNHQCRAPNSVTLENTRLAAHLARALELEYLLRLVVTLRLAGLMNTRPASIIRLLHL